MSVFDSAGRRAHAGLTKDTSAVPSSGLVESALRWDVGSYGFAVLSLLDYGSRGKSESLERKEERGNHVVLLGTVVEWWYGAELQWIRISCMRKLLRLYIFPLGKSRMNAKTAGVPR